MIVLINGFSAEFELWGYNGFMILYFTDLPDRNNIKKIILSFKSSYGSLIYEEHLYLYNALPPGVTINDKRVGRVMVEYLSRNNKYISSCAVISSECYVGKYLKYNKNISNGHPIIILNEVKEQIILPINLYFKRAYVYDLQNENVQIIGNDNIISTFSVIKNNNNHHLLFYNDITTQLL